MGKDDHAVAFTSSSVFLNHPIWILTETGNLDLIYHGNISK